MAKTQNSCGISLWAIKTGLRDKLWLFAYEDGGREYLPRVRDDADRRDVLAHDVWLEKRRMITDLYGFLPDKLAYRSRKLTSIVAATVTGLPSL